MAQGWGGSFVFNSCASTVCLDLQKHALNEDKQQGGGGTLRKGIKLGTPKDSFGCDSDQPSPLRSGCS